MRRGTFTGRLRWDEDMMDAAAAIKNYENSYKEMWAEIARARAERDNAYKTVDAARDLIISLEHDMNDGHETKVSLRTMTAFRALKIGLGNGAD